MRFSTPFALLLLLFVPYFVWLGRPLTPVTRSKWRQWASLTVRLLILLLLTLSLAGAQMVRAGDELAVIFLVDASDSISPNQAEQAEQFVRETISQLTVNDQAAVIVFGGNALVERPLSGLAELTPITTVPQTLQTDLAEAIRLGLALFPPGSARRLVILSDGAVTTGDTLEAARLAAASGVQIDYLPLTGNRADNEVMVTNVDAPTRVVEGETFSIDITVESTTNTTATLRVLASGEIVYQELVTLSAGTNNFRIRLRASAQEFARYQVQIEPTQDTFFQNNQLAAFTEIVGPPRILLVTNDDTEQIDESPQLRLALSATGLDVDVVTPAAMPASLGELSSYATVVMVNINAKNLSPGKMTLLQSFVRDLGGGLVVVGGPESYGMGGYFRTPLEETLPVDMQIQDQQRFPSVSIVIVIDRSGSMGAQEGGVTKIQLAAEGAVRVVELLNDFDEITVIPVDTAPDNPIGPISASQREEAIGLIRQIGAGGGGIYVRTGLEAAAEALAGSPNQVKHIILLADGADSEQKEGVPELVDALVADGVTITTVSIGDGPDVLWLRQVAEQGNGRFHFTDRAANLPQIFTQETTNIQRSYLIEERFFPSLVSNSPILANIRAVPPLYGYVGTSPKATAQVILETHMGDPLLAAWQYGLGRAVAWTSDATGRWGQDWVQWEGFPVFWTQLVRWTISEGRDSAVETAVIYENEQARLVVDARSTDNQFLNGLEMTANVVRSDGVVEQITLPQVAPGQYEAAFTPNSEGAYFIRVTGKTQGEDEAVVGQTTGWVLGYSPEYQMLEPNMALLAQMAELTNGRNLAEWEGDISQAVLDHSLGSQPTTRPIWHWLTLLAVVLLPVDIALRRLIITKRDLERAWESVFGRFRQQPVTVERTEQVSRLFEAKKRALSEQPEQSPVPFPQEPVQKSQERPFEKGQPSATPPKKPEASPGAASSLASRLLAKKREQTPDKEE
ncbi:MAG: VWA domain-containing protein [Candidatus Promineifilaceae bacterium]